MKKLIPFVSSLLILIATSSSSYLANDECTAYIPTKEGTKLSYSNYNGKDKLESRDEMTVKSIEEVGDKIEFTLDAKSWDKKDKEIYSDEYKFSCENGVFKISLESVMNQEMMEAYEDMEMTITQNEIKFPKEMTAGMKLPDANMKMELSSNGLKIMTVNMHVVNRTVEAIESITTDAGTFECAKIKSTQKLNMGFMKKTFHTVDWIAENVGNVRSETYDDKMKLSSYRVLTNLVE